MEIQKNSRQVPKVKSITASKYYSDILYCYLQVNSIKDESGRRIIPKKLIKFAVLAETLGLSRQTVSKRFKKLVELNLIQEMENGDWELMALEKEKAFLLPEKTMRILSNTLSDNAINVYVYLANRYYANKEEPFNFTISILKEFCGLGTNSSSNNYIINDILTILEQLNLIHYSVRLEQTDTGTQTTHMLKDLTLTIPFNC